MTSTDKGSTGEEFIFELTKRLVDKNAKYVGNIRESYDIVIFNKKIEIKTSTEDTSEHFQFNGIRFYRKYDYLLVLGISPNDIFFNIYNASDIKAQKIGVLVPMEKGAGKDSSHKLTRTKQQLYNISRFKEILEKVLKSN